MRNLIILILSSTFAIGCTKSLTTPVEVSNEKEQLVVNGFVAMINQTIPTAAVQVSKTLKLSQPGLPPILPDATVSINNVPFQYDINRSLYSTSDPLTGTAFKVTVTSGNNKAIAEDILPSFIPISTAEFTGTKKMITRYSGDTPEEYYELKITFDDPPQIGDYYQLAISATDSSRVANGFLFGNSGNSYDVASNDVSIYEEQVIEQDPFSSNSTFFMPSDMLLFQDKYFNGQKKELLIYVTEYFFMDFPQFPDTSMQQPQRSEYVHIGLHHMSKKSFDYYKNVKLQWWNDGNPFAEPTIISGNVLGALGFFGCRSVATTRVRTPE